MLCFVVLAARDVPRSLPQADKGSLAQPQLSSASPPTRQVLRRPRVHRSAPRLDTYPFCEPFTAQRIVKPASGAPAFRISRRVKRRVLAPSLTWIKAGASGRSVRTERGLEYPARALARCSMLQSGKIAEHILHLVWVKLEFRHAGVAGSDALHQRLGEVRYRVASV